MGGGEGAGRDLLSGSWLRLRRRRGREGKVGGLTLRDVCAFNLLLGMRHRGWLGGKPSFLVDCLGS